jgi:hypothetical protein
MDEYNEIVLAAFEDELEKIAEAELEKTAGIGSFLSKGLKGWSNVLGGTGKGIAQAARHSGGHWNLMKKIYQGGAGQRQGALAGLGRLAKSRYGQMAGAAAIPVAAGYGLARATSGSQRRQY